MKEIQLSQNKTALVDDDMYEYLNQWKWTSGETSVIRRVGGRIFHKTIYMHHVVLGISDNKIEIDHKNRNPFDNRKENLRVATRQEQNRNRGKNKNNNTGYKGVSYSRRKDKYYVCIMVDYKQISLGYFKTPEEAAKVYDVAAKKYFGEFAFLNFKENS